ncbi:MAG: FAD-dependent oxidoreductase [Chloroflexi bacterium]|nr:FAD-dependent oxidoreductase [Chloroflexota bacterium]
MAVSSPDVVIIGAGAVGCATAYFLAREGLRPLLIERDALASHASGFAFGGLNPTSGAGIPGPVLPLAKESMRLHLALHQALREGGGVETGFRLASMLAVALSEGEVDQLKANLAWQRREGFAVRWLEGQEAGRMEPRLSPHILGALQVEGVGLLESYRYVLALAQAAERSGATIQHGVVAGFQRHNERLRGVVLQSGASIPCDRAVLAAGPWAGEAGAWLGAEVPVEPLKGQILRLRLPGPPLEHYVSWAHCYAATKGDGLVWSGTTEERSGFDEHPTSEARLHILEGLLRVMPSFADAEVVQQTACLRPLSRDGLPILGEVPGWQGLYLAAGAGRKGILLSAGMGRAVADLIVRGHTDIPVAPFLPLRFAGSGAFPRPDEGRGS